MKRQANLFERITPFENLLLAARKAARGKRDKPRVARFEFHLEQELLALQEELVNGGYRPGAFFSFEIRDPKRRNLVSCLPLPRHPGRECRDPEYREVKPR